MSLLSYFQIVQRDLLDPAGPLSSELSPSAIAEANTAVNRVQQAKAKETKKRGPYIKFDEKTKIKIGKYSSENGVHAAARHFSMSTRARFASSTHCFLEGTRAVGEVKISELFVPIQSMSPGRNFYPAKILCYTVIQANGVVS